MSSMKYVLSYLKSDWDLQDYPIRYRRQQPENDIKWMRTPSWSVSIVNWWVLCGMGSSKQEAYEDLRRNFLMHKQRPESLPRPGTAVPLVFARTNEIARYDDIATDFLLRVLGIDYSQSFISDQSTLADFLFVEDDATYRANMNACCLKVRTIYGTDISDIENGELWRIFARIRECGYSPQHIS
jgi:hypothetical protein